MYAMSCLSIFIFFFFKQKTAYEMRISDWSSDVCSSDLLEGLFRFDGVAPGDEFRAVAAGAAGAVEQRLAARHLWIVHVAACRDAQVAGMEVHQREHLRRHLETVVAGTVRRRAAIGLRRRAIAPHGTPHRIGEGRREADVAGEGMCGLVTVGRSPALPT